MKHDHHDLPEGLESCPVRIFTGTSWEDGAANIVREVHLAVHLDGQKVTTIACTGVHTKELALGWLRSEGIIGSVGDIESVEVGRGGTAIHISTRGGLSGRFAAAGPVAFERGISRDREMGGGTIISSSGARSAPVEINIRDDETGSSGMSGAERVGQGLKPLALRRKTISPARIFMLMEDLVAAAGVHRLSRGTHGAALTDGSRILATREDIGRHNCLDMLSGYSLLSGIDGGDKILLRTGRVSSEIVFKVWRMGIPVVLSLSVPTALAVSLAVRAGITLVGAIRAPSLTVYTHAKRIR